MTAVGMTDAAGSPSGSLGAWSAVLRHALCVLALMWTGIVNGQPFFFADSTNYIRAADLAAHLVSGRTVSTVWTERYRSVLPRSDGVRVAPSAETPRRHSANDIGAGLVMSGRSPYIGALMYAGWALGWFWPFVVLQAATAYGLIILILRRFDLGRPNIVTTVSIGLAATTSLPTYNSLLLADAFASFGILAFVLLALPGALSRWQLAFLIGTLVVAVIAHLTHLMILLGMMAALAILQISRLMKPPPRAWQAAGAVVLVAIAALQVTSVATRAALGREPQLLPLLTARFYMDGPGRAFVAAGCENGRFQVCRIPIRHPVNNAGWLFDDNPATGAYMLASTDERRRMGEEDVAFARAVLHAYPLKQIKASVGNTLRQLVWIDYHSLNQGCRPDPGCWENLPPSVHKTFDKTLSGRNAWPQYAMNILLYVVVIGSLIALAVALPRLARCDHARFVALRNALLIIAAAMLVCSFFGGAVADPQYRYQGRLAWLPVLFAALAVLALRHPPSSHAAALIGRRAADAIDLAA